MADCVSYEGYNYMVFIAGQLLFKEYISYLGLWFIHENQGMLNEIISRRVLSLNCTKSNSSVRPYITYAISMVYL